MRWPRRIASSRRSPTPGSCQRETRPARSRPVLAGTTPGARVKSGSRSSSSGSMVVTANSGISPTIERTLQRHVASPSPAGAARRRRTRPPRPRARCRRRRCCSSRRRCRGSARRTWWRCPRRRGSSQASSSAMVSMFRQNMPIQLVPSLCSMWPPVGSGALRSNTPMLSRPRKPPWKTLLPSRVLAIHPPGEVQHQLVEDALQERRGRPTAAAFGSIL